jgi:hypothetical protein
MITDVQKMLSEIFSQMNLAAPAEWVGLQVTANRNRLRHSLQNQGPVFGRLRKILPTGKWYGISLHQTAKGDVPSRKGRMVRRPIHYGQVRRVQRRVRLRFNPS